MCENEQKENNWYQGCILGLVQATGTSDFLRQHTCWIQACRGRSSSCTGELEWLDLLAPASPATCYFPDDNRTLWLVPVLQPRWFAKRHWKAVHSERTSHSVLEIQEGSCAWHICIVELKEVCTDFKSAEEGRNNSELAGRKPPLKIRALLMISTHQRKPAVKYWCM